MSRSLPLVGALLALTGAGLAVASASMPIRAVGAALVVIGIVILLLGGRGSSEGGQILLEQDLSVARSQLQQVTEQALKLAKGEAMSARVEKDDTQHTLAALHQVAGKMQAMVEARAHIVATERDLDQARRMYRQILPLSSATEHGGLSLAGSCLPAAETGGDWWTYRKLPGGRALVVIGDATGHGVHSAMIGCMAHGAVRALTQMGHEFLTARRVLDSVHTAITVPGIEHAAMTLFAAEIDPKEGTVTYVNHGHVFPLLAMRDASGTITEVSSITGDRNVTDDSEDSNELEIRSGTAKLPPGVVLICFTDGLIERANPAGRAFGARRLQQALVGVRVPPGVDGLTQLRDRVLAKVDEYCERAPLEDDITLVLATLS